MSEAFYKISEASSSARTKEVKKQAKVVAALALHGWAIQKEERSPAPQMKLKGLCNWGIRGERITKNTPARRKRQLHVRKKVSGTAERPRLCVHRSNNHMSADMPPPALL